MKAIQNVACTHFLQGQSIKRRRTKTIITVIWGKTKHSHLPLECIFLAYYDTEDTLPQYPGDWIPSGLWSLQLQHWVPSASWQSRALWLKSAGWLLPWHAPAHLWAAWLPWHSGSSWTQYWRGLWGKCWRDRRHWGRPGTWRCPAGCQRWEWSGAWHGGSCLQQRGCPGGQRRLQAPQACSGPGLARAAGTAGAAGPSAWTRQAGSAACSPSYCLGHCSNTCGTGTVSAAVSRSGSDFLSQNCS